MLRGALTAYLVFFTAAGPCLACCAASRLLTAAAPAPARAEEAAAPCCCGGDDTASPACEAPRSPQPPAPPSCPCDDHPARQGSVAVASAATAELSLLRWSLELTSVTAAFADPIAPTAPAVPPGAAAPADPFLSASDLLHVQHRLRC
jgi:hypothetical protein